MLHYGCSLSDNVTQRFLLRCQHVNYAGSLSLIWIIVLLLWGYTNKSLNWDAQKQIVLSPICLFLIFVAFMVVHWFVDMTPNRVDAQKQFVLVLILLVLFILWLFILTNDYLLDLIRLICWFYGCSLIMWSSTDVLGCPNTNCIAHVFVSVSCVASMMVTDSYTLC